MSFSPLRFQPLPSMRRACVPTNSIGDGGAWKGDHKEGIIQLEYIERKKHTIITFPPIERLRNLDFKRALFFNPLRLEMYATNA